ncbi:histidine phosphatase family protein [Microbacterium sp. Se63.02b]|uniref:histidine phosphatase family protein n=1 Tax=Microbacterium sp. Se63.02b TaxID=2709304 RepID=UPI001605174B|nr:histidine phosphatase family protein [Microbacterium sp. Se63.02b]QNA92537.1 histidine phosphatase family protein [Microbacterium sp. Se63.02b]QYM66042.1 histidine phosphatase family protein [Microbacterium sp. Se5.02b]
MPERLLLARHGQTTWNLERRLQGQLDSPLTAEGIEQARALAERLADVGVVSVCSSPLGRAWQTAIIIADRIGADLIEVPELAEVDHGELAGMTWEEIDEAYPTAREERAANRYGWAFPGGESYAQARARARKALSSCGWASTGVPLLVSHEMIGRMLRAELRGLDATNALALRHPHGVVFEIDRTSERML